MLTLILIQMLTVAVLPIFIPIEMPTPSFAQQSVNKLPHTSRWCTTQSRLRKTEREKITLAGHLILGVGVGGRVGHVRGLVDREINCKKWIWS